MGDTSVGGTRVDAHGGGEPYVVNFAWINEPHVS